MKIGELLIGILWFTGGHTLAFLQRNGQFFKTSWFRDNEFWVAAAGIIISYFYMYGTANLVEAFNGKLWPPRLLSFATGIFSFTFLTFILFKEGINMKTGVTLFLAFTIVLIQVFWK